MAIRNVGPNQTYRTISAAITAAQAGDTIVVQAGQYVNDFPPTIAQSLTLTGVSGMAHMSATVPIPNGKAFISTGLGAPTDSAVTVTVNNFEFSGANVVDNNGAGIRFQGGTLVINGCYFHDNQEGILGGVGSGTVTINNSEFFNNSSRDGHTHNIYLQPDTLNLNNVYSHSTPVGHNLKSRAHTTTITNSRFQDENADTSYVMDFPNGGVVSISGCTIEKGINAQNHNAMVAFGEEGGAPADSSLTIANTTFINHCAQLQQAVWNTTSVAASITGCSAWAVTTMLSGPGVNAGTVVLAADPPLVTTHPWKGVSPPPPPPPPGPTKASILAQCSVVMSTMTKIMADIAKL